MSFDIDAIYRLHNYSDEDFKAEYEFRHYLIPAGADAWLPAGVVVCWLGDPEAPTSRNGHKSEERYNEVNRLRSMYGAYTDDDVWELNKPKLHVFDGTGERVLTVVDDPQGDQMRGTEYITPSQDMAFDRIERLEAELRSLRTQLTPQSQGSLAESTVAIDEPVLDDRPAPKSPPKDKSDAIRVS